jgi:pyridoxal/pyridoxine/pyridoxamine kinase
MAVGMTNSSHALNKPQAATIRSGEVVASNMQAIKNQNARVFHHMIPGANFIMPDGLEIKFLGGQFVTDDPEVIAELEAVADKPTSMIFTKTLAVEAAKELTKRAAADAADTAGTIKE